MRSMRPAWLKCLIFTVAVSAAAFSCDRPTRAAAADLPKPAIDLPAEKDSKAAVAVFAGGCFWCTEAAFEQLEGITDVVSGYAGGKADDAKYETVSAGLTNHAESIQITYDPSKISYGQLLRVLFTVIDPTTKDGQHPDYGRQYRSAVFYSTDAQKRVAEAYIRQLNDAKLFDAPIATTVESFDKFYPAEGYHQDYVKKNPDHPYVQRWSVPKVEKVKKHFPELLKRSAPATTRSAA